MHKAFLRSSIACIVLPFLFALGCESEEPNADELDFSVAPAARALTRVVFDLPVQHTEAAGPYAFLMHEDSGFSLLELGANVAKRPITYGPFETRGTVLAVEYDEAARVAYVVDSSGTISIVDLSSGPSIRIVSTIVVNSLDLQGAAMGSVQIARNAQRLLILHERVVQPIFVSRASGTWLLAPEKAVTLPRIASRIASSGGNVYIGYANRGEALIEIWNTLSGALSRVSSVTIGGQLVTLLSRGTKVIVLSKTVGLSVVDFYVPGQPRIVYQNAQLGDVAQARLFGRTLLVSLELKKLVSTLDVSDFAHPSVLTSNPGELPTWIAMISGNLFMGNAEAGTVGGVPPVFAAGVPELIRNSFPLAGQIPLTFSKPIDPAALAKSGIKLVCNGVEVKSVPWLSPDGLTINIRPLTDLLANQRCTLDLSGIFGWNDLPVASGTNGKTFAFTTAQKPMVPTSPGSKHRHVADGKFTDCKLTAAVSGDLVDDQDAGIETAQLPDAGDMGSTQDAAVDAGSESDSGECEWFDVNPAQGRYTYFYADFDGENLWILNDWFYNGEDIEPDCYNQFQAWTGDGAERWEIRAYGDQHVEVTRNGIAVDASAMGVQGGKFYGPSPNVAEPHTIYELKIPASAGGWGVQLHDPGPTFLCNRLEADTLPLTGSVISGQQGGTFNPNVNVKAPTAPDITAPVDGAVDQAINPDLFWNDKNEVNTFVSYQVQLSTDERFSSYVLDLTTWSKQHSIPRGLLQPDTKYYWRVSAQNQAGSAVSAVFSFTTTKTPKYVLTTGVSGQGNVVSDDSPRTLDCRSSSGNCLNEYTTGTTLQLTATAAEGWTFAGWTGACSGTETTIDILIGTLDQYCVATFTAPNGSSTLWTSRAGNGSGSIGGIPAGIHCGNDCNEVYANGTPITLTATPDEGSIFNGWYGDCSGNAPTVTVSVDHDVYCTASFIVPQSNKRWLSISPQQGGSVTSDVGGIACPSSVCQQSYDPDTVVTLTATPQAGYTFDGWTGDCQGSSSTATVTLSTYRSCGALFSTNTPQLNVYVGGPGSVTSAPDGITCSNNGGNGCTAMFGRGSVVTLTASPSTESSVFAGWSGDCSGSSLTTTVTMNAAKSCSAQFTQTMLNVYVTGLGTVTGNKGSISCVNNGGNGCSAQLAPGTEVTLTAVAGSGYKFASWGGDCSGQSTTAKVTLSGSKSCTASFTTNTLLVYVGGSGSVSSSPSGISCTTNGGVGCSTNFANATSVQLTAAPVGDFVFIGWSGCSTSQNASISVNVSGTQSCTANFASNSNTLYVYGNGNGAGTVTSSPAGVSCNVNGQSTTGTCQPVFAYNQVVQLTAAPASTSEYFSGWGGSCTGTGLTTSVTMNGGKSCYATFTKNRLSIGISGSGTVSSSPGSISCNSGQGTCSGDFPVGGQVQLTAAPGANYVFSGWSGCSQSSNAQITITLGAASSCTATFTTNTLTTYVNQGTGSITSMDTFISCSTYGGAGCSRNYATFGTQVQLTAAPASNQVFIGWSGCSQSTNPMITVAMNGSQNCYANFTTNTLTTYVSQGTGTITSMDTFITCSTNGGAGCSYAYPSYGQMVQLTAAPGTNQAFIGWSGCSQSTNTSITVTMNGSQNCYATFEPTSLTAYVSAGMGTITSNTGGISCTTNGGTGCSATYAPSSMVQLTAAPSSNYFFSGWTGDCSGTNPVVQVTVNRSKSCYAQFLTNKLTISYLYNAGTGTVTTSPGTISCTKVGGTCVNDFAYNQQVQITATPAVGNTFVQWYGTCSSQGAVATLNMTGDVTCYPVFAVQSYATTVSVTGRGAVTSAPAGIACGSDCTESYPYQTALQLAAIPFSGETFQGWGGDCAASGTTAVVAFNTPASAVNCTATFTSLNTSTSFNGAFSSAQYDSSQCSTWNDFRSTLSADTVYDAVKISGSLDVTGTTCSGASANDLCQALRTGSVRSGVVCGGKTWDVNANCGSTGSVELHAGPAASSCQCGSSGHYSVRPCYQAAGYAGGIGNSCGAASQTLAVDCTPSALSLTVTGNGSVSSSPSGIDCPGDCSEALASSTLVTLTAAPASGETFNGWTGDCLAAGTNLVAMITASSSAPKKCGASFTSSEEPRVLIAAAETSSVVTSLQTALFATGAFSSVDALPNTTLPTTPSLSTLMQYDVVLVWSNYTFSDKVALGNNLADYYDAGGRVVLAMFATSGYEIGGKFALPANGYVLIDTAASFGSCGGTALGTVAEPASPLMVGVSTIGAPNYCASGGLVNGATTVASYSGGKPMVVRGTVQGRKRVDLNMWPSGISGDSITLFKNALLYE